MAVAICGKVTDSSVVNSSGFVSVSVLRIVIYAPERKYCGQCLHCLEVVRVCVRCVCNGWHFTAASTVCATETDC